jgi:hypothetical protein
MKKICVLVVVFICACTKDTQRTHKPKPIVEAYLSPGKPVLVKITQEATWSTLDSLVPVEGLTPILVQNHIVHSLTYMGKGIYGKPGILIQEKDSCSLHFQYQGKEVSAYTVIPIKPTGFTCNTDTIKILDFGNFIDPTAIQFAWNNPGNDYHLVVVKNLGPTWGQVQQDTYYPKWKLHFYTSPTKESSIVVSVKKNFFYKGRDYLILYRILPEYAVVFNKNNNSSLNLSNAPTNITNGFGIFTGFSTADTLTLWVQDK